MKKTVFSEGFAFVYLNKGFYTKELIEKTVLVYKEFFSASVGELGKYFVVKIKKLNDDYSLQNLSDEFLNYLLSEEYGK